jgi:hypothetical protein
VTPFPPPSVPWQITGNHWLSLPCIHPADGSIHAVGLLHRGSRAAIEFAGSAEFLTGGGPPLLRPAIEMDGVRRELSTGPMAWEWALGWLPMFTCPLGGVVVRGTVFAPYGRDADVAGAVYALSLENRSDTPQTAVVSLEGTLGHRQLRVRTPRAFDDDARARRVADGMLTLEGAAHPTAVALAIGGDADAAVDVAEGPAPSFAVRQTVEVPGGGRGQVAFYIAAGPERDGAEATVRALRRRGWRDLLGATRDALQELEQSTGSDVVDRLVNRNLLFAYFYAVGRAIDDAHYYLVRTRAPWHSAGVTIKDWEALSWTIPAVQLADHALARELILRACELHGYAPGQGVHYFDGTLFEPGFSLEGAAAYAIAVDRYIRDTGDDEIVEEPAIADTLYLSHDDVAHRRDKRVPLYSTEVNPAGAPVPYPFTLHGNAVVAQALEVFRRTLDEESARDVEDPEAVRAAIRRHFAVEGSRGSLASAVDLAGGVTSADDPAGSALWLPLYEAIERQDSSYRRTVRAIGRDSGSLAQECGRLLGPDATGVLQWLRRATLDGGFAAELIDEDGRAVGNGGDAALSGLLAWTAWYAVHALGAQV